MRILIAEDSTLLRDALVALLERLGHEIVAAVATAGDLLDRFEASRNDAPDLVLTDVRMPPGHGDDGLVAALRIRALSPTQPIVVLSQYVAGADARELLSLPEGAVGYLLKDRVGRARDFAASLERVVAGGTVIDPEVVQHLLRPHDHGPLRALTGREHEVLALMADGLSNADIAQRLVVSDAAVRKHVGNVFSKLGLTPVDDNRRVRAVLTFLQHVGDGSSRSVSDTLSTPR